MQREEFERLGRQGDWQHPYTTMSFDAEATIARELMKFAMNGTLYRGSKPVMWSVVEQTALAEAEVEYQEVTSHTIFVKFPIEPPLGPLSVTVHGEEGEEHPTPEEVEAFNDKVAGLAGASVVIWTTTPWTIPGNRAIAFSPDIAYGLYEVVEAPEDNWAKPGDRLVLADALADNVRNAARIESWRRTADVDPRGLIASHPLRRHPEAKGDYAFPVPVLPGDFVTEDTGTGFVHIAPGHGQDDFELGTKFGIKVPFTVDADGRYIDAVGIFAGRRVIDDKGAEGDANAAVIAALQEVGALVARGRLRHDYPHSWRSKKPVIFRNTPQWFIAMDYEGTRRSLRHAAGARPRRHRRHALGAAPRREPHPGHDPDQTRLGGVASARLGRAHHRVPQQRDGRRHSLPRIQRLGRVDRPHRRGFRHGRRRRLVRGWRQGAFPLRPRR